VFLAETLPAMIVRPPLATISFDHLSRIFIHRHTNVISITDDLFLNTQAGVNLAFNPTIAYRTAKGIGLEAVQALFVALLVGGTFSTTAYQAVA
jgi:hypothetical protein